MTQFGVEALQEPLLKIGELAKQTDVTVGTLRYYEGLGLLEPAQRSISGYRFYTVDAVRQVKFIKKAQSLSFSLEEIRQIVNSRRQGIVPCPLVRDLLDSKIAFIEQQIHRMIAFKAELKAYKKSWEDRPSDNPGSEELCSLIEEVSEVSALIYENMQPLESL